MRRGHRHRPLTPDEVARNRSPVPIRSAIERVFGTLKRSYGWVRVRYRGLARNAAHLDLLFPGMEILARHLFRVTRNEDLEVEEDDAENLLFALEKELLRRKIGRPPVRLEVGPVLAIEDAVGNKVGALFSRAETRDYLDVDAIRRSGRYSDKELLNLARNADAGFDLGRFAQNLDNVERIQPEEVRVYGLTASQLDDVKTRTKAWAASIRGLARRESTRSGLHERIEREV